MQLRRANRQAVKLRVGFSGTSGSGKTLSALRAAFGLVGSWDKIAVVDTEAGSGELYADREFSDGQGGTFHIGSYQYINLTQFSPEKYIEAIIACEKAGIEVIIIDSITHSWNYILDVQSQMTGNSYQNWGVVKPRHARLTNKILQSVSHVFTTVRRKQDYEMTKDGDGKAKVVKLGLKEVNIEGWEYELTLNLEIEQNHKAKAAKDRTGLFSNADPFMITEDTGRQLLAWATSGAADEESLLQIATVEISNAVTVSELNAIFFRMTSLQKVPDFMAQLKAREAQIKNPQAAVPA